MSSPSNGILPPMYRLSMIKSTHSLKDARLKCSTGCLTGRCGCKKRGKHCSIGCECLNCGNNIAESRQNEAHINFYLWKEMWIEDRKGEDIVDWVFGQNTGSESQTSQSKSEPESDL